MDLQQDNKPRPWLHTAIFFAVALVLIFAHSIDEKFDVDENVFVASGALMRDGVLPYRDYHYNHMPTLVLIYSALFKASDHLLLASRSFSVVCAAIAVTSVFHVALGAFTAFGERRRLLFAWGMGFLFLANPLFTDVTGKAWNHDVPAAAMLLAFLAMRHGLANGAAALWMVVSGALIGIAVTTRLTFAPGCLGFLLLVLLYPGLSVRRRFGLLACVTLGGLVAVMPSAWVWWQSPENAYFGNVLYPKLNTRYHEMVATRDGTDFSLFGRLRYILWKLLVLPGNGLLVVMLFMLVPRVFRWAQVRVDRAICEIFALLVIILSLYGGVMVTSPTYQQYLYAPTPFMLLALTLTLAAYPKFLEIPLQRWFVRTCIALTLLIGCVEYNGLSKLPFVDRWVPMQVHQLGDEIAAQVDGGRVLTLSPAFPLEGGALIYEDLATGRFGLRVARFLTEPQQGQYQMPGAEDVIRLFDQPKPPDAVLVNDTDKELEPLLARTALEHGYQPIELRPKVTLYLRPQSEPPTTTRASTVAVPATQR